MNVDLNRGNAGSAFREERLDSETQLIRVNIASIWTTSPGALCTIRPCRKWFTHPVPLPPPTSTAVGDKSAIPSTSIGCTLATTRAKGERAYMALRNVLYVPELYGDTLFVPHLAGSNAEARFEGQDCHVHDQREQLTRTSKRGRYGHVRRRRQSALHSSPTPLSTLSEVLRAAFDEGGPAAPRTLKAPLERAIHAPLERTILVHSKLLSNEPSELLSNEPSALLSNEPPSST